MKKIMLLIILLSALGISSNKGQGLVLVAGAGINQDSVSTLNYEFVEGRIMFYRVIHRFRIGPWVNLTRAGFSKPGYSYTGKFITTGLSLDKVLEVHEENWNNPKYRNWYFWLNAGIRWGYAHDHDDGSWQSWQKSRTLNFQGGVRVTKPKFNWFRNGILMYELELPLSKDVRFSVMPGIVEEGIAEHQMMQMKISYENGVKIAAYSRLFNKSYRLEPIAHLGFERREGINALEYGAGLVLGDRNGYWEPLKLLYCRSQAINNERPALNKISIIINLRKN